MKTQPTKGLTGLIMSSSNPAQLAQFYKSVLGIPFELQSHGNLPAHSECDYQHIHYAILQRRGSADSTPAIVPSYAVDDIDDFVTAHNLKMTHPVMDLGGGSFVATTQDADGNVIRLWAHQG